MPILTLLNWRWIVAGAIVAALSASHLLAYRAGSASTQAAWDAQTAAQTLQTLRLVEAAQDKERGLQEVADNLRKAKNDQVQKLSTDLAAALNSLRNRPHRPSDASLSATTGPGPAGLGCYPSQLYAEDARVVVNIAAEADQLRAYAEYCQAQYNKARDAVK